MKRTPLTRMVSESKTAKNLALRFRKAEIVVADLETLMPDFHRDRYRLSQIRYRMDATGAVSPEELEWLCNVLQGLFN